MHLLHFCVFNNKDFWFVFFAIFFLHFLNFLGTFFCIFLLSGADCVVDLLDIDNIRDNQHAESYSIGMLINNTPKTTCCICPKHRFLEMIRSLTTLMRTATREAPECSPPQHAWHGDVVLH